MKGMDVAAVLHRFKTLATAAGFQEQEMGRVGEWTLPAFVRPRPGAPRIYLSSGIHGDEPAGVLALLELFQTGFFDDRATWSVCPLLNPTGLTAGVRENAAGLDLNREYLRAVSPEITAHTAWLRKQEPHGLALSLHEDWETTGFYLYEINTSERACLGPDILQSVQRVIGVEPGRILDGHQVTAPGYIFHPAAADDPECWPEAIFHVRLVPQISCTFETPSSAVPLERRVQAHVAAVRRAVELYLAG